MKQLESVRRTLHRWGAFLLRPRATAAALSPREGIFDGLWLGLAYIVGSQLVPLGQIIKTFMVTASSSRLLSAAGGLGRMLLAPIIVILLVELLLGRDKAYRRGIYLLPFVLVTTAANLLRQYGGATFDDMAPIFIGGAASLALVFFTRAQVPAEGEGAATEPPSLGSSQAALLASALSLGAVLASGGHDARLYFDRWDRWGPLGPSDELPKFVARGFDGPELRDADLEGKVTVLAFWATWCGPCAREMPTLETLHRSYADAPVQVIGVNRDREGDVPALVAGYRQAKGLSFRMVYDAGGIGQAFRVSLIPHMVIVDKRAKIRFVHQGAVSESALRKEIDALLAES